MMSRTAVREAGRETTAAMSKFNSRCNGRRATRRAARHTTTAVLYRVVKLPDWGRFA
jgi:hypothetical protein